MRTAWILLIAALALSGCAGQSPTRAGAEKHRGSLAAKSQETGAKEVDVNNDGRIDDDLIATTITRDSELSAGLASKQNALGYTAENAANKGKNNGYAELDGNGLVPSTQLPAGSGDGINHATSDGNYYASRNGAWANLAGVFVATETDPAFSAWDKDYADLINTPAIPAALADLGDDATHRIVTDAEKSAWNAKLGALPTWMPSTGPTADNQIIQATGAGTSVWTSVVDGLINDAGTGTDDLLSASEIAIRIAAAAASGTDDQTAAEVGVSVANFGGNLSTADDTVQKALETLDDMTGGGTVDLTAPGPIGSITPNTGNFTTLSATAFDTTAPATGETGEIGLGEDPANGTNTVTVKAPAAMAADLIFTLPNAYAAATNYALVGNGSGVLSFAQVLLPTSIGNSVQAYDADLDDLADGSLAGTKVDLAALTGTIYSTGNLYGRFPVIAKAATATLTAQECSSTLVTNTGAQGAIVLTLPDAVAGMRVSVALTTGKDVDINPYGTERILNLTDADGDAISSDGAVGSYITLVAVSGTQWMQIGASGVGGSGTWTDVN